MNRNEAKILRDELGKHYVDYEVTDSGLVFGLNPNLSRLNLLRIVEDAVCNLDEHRDVTYITVIGEFGDEESWIVGFKRNPEDLRRYLQRLAYRSEERIEADSEPYLKIAGDWREYQRKSIMTEQIQL